MTDSDAIRREFDRRADEELIAILQDWDPDQWRPEVFDIVASILESRGISTRDIMVTDSEDVESDRMELEEARPRNLITVAEYFTAIEAHTDRLALEQGGLKAWVVEAYHAEAIVIGGAFGARLQVRPEDLAAAMEILEAPLVPSSSLPPELSDLKCPRCGSMDVTEADEVLDILDPSSALQIRSERRAWFFRCASCAHTWS